MEQQLQLPWMGQQLELALQHEPELEAKDFRCKNCIHFIRQSYRSMATFFYCGQKRSNLTDNGFKKIKANDLGCSKFSMNAKK